MNYMEEAGRNRALKVKELEDYFGKRVFALIYNPLIEEGISEDDEFYFRDFIIRMIKRQNLKNCIILLNGFGGNLRTAIACSQLLRDNLEYYECFVPSSVSSSISYFILQSDRLLIGEKSIITQIDPIFEDDNGERRAIENLANEDKEISRLSRSFFSPVIENLKRVIKTPPNVFETEVVKQSQKSVKSLKKVIDFWMGKKFHESRLDLQKISTLKIKHKIVPPEIIQKAIELIKDCREELIDENARFVIQTSYIHEEKYLGGFFYDKKDKSSF